MPFLVRPHQPRIPRHIGGEDRGEPAGLAHFASPVAKRRPDRNSSRSSAVAEGYLARFDAEVMRSQPAITSRASSSRPYGRSRRPVRDRAEASWSSLDRQAAASAPPRRSVARKVCDAEHPEGAARYGSRGLRRSERSVCSIARSCWPAHVRSGPLVAQPRAKLGLSASAARSEPIASDVLAEKGQREGGVDEYVRVSPAASSA